MGPGTSSGGTGGTRLTSLTPEVIDWLASVLGSFPTATARIRLEAFTAQALAQLG